MYFDFLEFFYGRLTALRERKGVSAREMSAGLGQNSGYINKIENRKALPSLEGFFYICDYFKLTPKEFFDDGIHYPLDMAEIIKDLQALSPDQLANISKIIKELKK